MSKRRAFVTGITGQDGSYLAELLLDREYEVYGLVRRTSTNGTGRIAHILNRLELIPGDLSDSASLERALDLANPHEIYNLAAQTFVSASFVEPLHTADVTGLGALRLFEAARQRCPSARIYHASSSEMYGKTPHVPQGEDTPFQPVSPYGAAKVFAHYCAQLYRQAYKMFIACGINFNHESERRGEEFVTRKITKAIARIKVGDQWKLHLGNLHAQRDWSHAEAVMRAAIFMLSKDTPDDYVIASGESHSVEEFVKLAFDCAGLTVEAHLVIDPALFRPSDVDVLQGDAQKARRELNWAPTVSFSTLVSRMVQYDCEAYQRSPAIVASYPRRP